MNIWMTLKSLKKKFRSKKKIYSSLTGRKASDKEHQHVHNIWNRFEMKAMKCYHDLHLKCDVLLLADVFRKIRNNSLKSYRLCPSHYLSHQVYIRMQCLKWKKISLNLFQILTCIWSLKLQKAEFLFLTDIAKPTINILYN